MEHEAIIRLSIFLGVFGALSLVEVLNPRRARVVSRKSGGHKLGHHPC